MTIQAPQPSPPSRWNLRLLLGQELDRRRTDNPSYSLRAFAKWLGLAAPELSLYLRGRRNYSTKRVLGLARKLGYHPGEITEILRESLPPHPTPISVRSATTLDIDQYLGISEWQHFAILSLMETEDFQSKPEWIARRLGITPTLAAQSIERLIRLDMVEVVSKRPLRWRASGRSYTTSDEIRNDSLRLAHRKNLDLAARSLQSDPLELRDFTSMTMAIDPDKLPEAKQRIRRFRDELCAFLEAGAKREVYKLNLNLIPLTQVKKENP